MNNSNKNRLNNKKKELRPECKSMCPEDEVNLRIKNNLVHVLEKRLNNLKLEYKLVKEYSRPAADKYIKSEQLRTIDTLLNTSLYLVNEVYTRKDIDYLVKYEFLFDRFRAIRQDLTIQRCRSEKCLRILEIILCFYLIADYKLFSNKNYDEYINCQHLTEVLNFIISNENCKKKLNIFLSVFILLNLNNLQAISNLLKNSKELRTEFPLSQCIKLSNAYLNRNYINLFKSYKKLPLLCQLALHRKIPAIENEMMKTMGSAYAFKNVRYPIENLLKISLFRNNSALQRFVEAKLIIIDLDTIIFNKPTSNISLKNERDYLDFIDDELSKINEVEFILGNAFKIL